MSEQQDLPQELRDCALHVRGLLTAVQSLGARAELLGVGPLLDREWYQLLRQKLVPQLGERGWLVAAVVGGTNIGKSVIFNHIAGCQASAISPLASGTRHPTCLVPERFGDPEQLRQIFPDFELRAWEGAEGALAETSENLLFWRVAAELPETLVVLDTPDIDSDARVNWLRADAVRRSADILIAVLTQQKYNDAAVKEFFRRGAREGRSAVVVFNQVQLPDDEPYWGLWLETFCGETGLRPEAVYLAPRDRRAAEGLRLPFFERVHEMCVKGLNAGEAASIDSTESVAAVPGEIDELRAVNLGVVLGRLRFGELRLRALRGSLDELVNESRGVSSWLRQLGLASDELGRSSARLESGGLITVRGWPAPGGVEMSAGVREWWRTHQTGWARAINGAYGAAGRLVLGPLRALQGMVLGEVKGGEPGYREREWLAILSVVEGVYERLSWLADSGHPAIRERAAGLMSGERRSEILDWLKREHSEVDFEREIREVIDEQMQRMQRERPELFGICRQAGNVSAALRPVASVVLFSLGFGPAGDLAATALGQAAASALVHVAADVAGGTAAALAGEAAVSTAASSGAGFLQAWLQRLQNVYVERRGRWLMDRLQGELLGTLPEELRGASRIRELREWHESERHLAGVLLSMRRMFGGGAG